MEQKMTFVRVDASDTITLTNLSKVAIHRGIQFMYVTDTELYNGDDMMVFFTDKFSLLSSIEEIKLYTNMTDDIKDGLWNIVQCSGEEHNGEVSLGFTITKDVKLF